MSLLLALIEIQAQQLASGPQAIKDSASASNSTQKSQKRYATKEIILYLTPSQIKALQAGKAFVNTQSIFQPTEKQAQNDQRLSIQEHDELVRQQFENIKAAKVSQAEKPSYDNLELVSNFPSYQNEELTNGNQKKISDAIDAWKQRQAKIDEQAKSQYLQSQSDENQNIKQWPLRKLLQPEISKNDWTPYNPASENDQEAHLLNEQFNKQWNRILEHNRNQLKVLSAVKPINENSEPTQFEKPLLQEQYAPRHNDQKHAIALAEFLKNHNKNGLEKENSLAKAEAIANSPPILIHQEIRVTKHKPVPIIKNVKVHVPTPVLIPVPEPYEVKVPHPYPVPFEIVKSIPVPIWKSENVKAENPGSYETQKQASSPVTKNVYINFERPFYVEKLVPIEI